MYAQKIVISLWLLPVMGMGHACGSEDAQLEEFTHNNLRQMLCLCNHVQ